MSTARPRVVVAIPPARLPDVFTEAALDRLRSFADAVFVEGDTAAVGAQVAGSLPGADVVLTGWGSPPLDDAQLDQAPRLRLIAHTAGSVKRLVPPSVFARGITVCHAASIIADAVAEMTLLLMLACLRDLDRLDQAMKTGQPWRALPPGYAPRQLTGRAVGLLGGGYVVRRLLRLLQPFDLTVRVYDPYLPADQAASLGIRLVDLAEVLSQSDVVSVHVPITPETHHMLGARELALLRDGAVFVNTARAWAVDQAALLAELQTGRISAALDVFEPEPLPPDSPFRRLDNVVLTPHQAGHTVDTYRRQGLAMVEEIERFWTGQPLRYQITAARHAVMA
jgi:phosphoglycerate dehydrogenase-like enzyme